MTSPAIRVSHLSKRYRIGARKRHDTLRESLTHVVYRPQFRVCSPHG